jgi:hypothetical protein
MGEYFVYIAAGTLEANELDPRTNAMNLRIPNRVFHYIPPTFKPQRALRSKNLRSGGEN